MKIQIGLRIRTVWLESSLGAFRIAEDAKFLHVETEASARMLMLDNEKLMVLFLKENTSTISWLLDRVQGTKFFS